MTLHILTATLALAGLLSACAMAPSDDTPAAPVPSAWPAMDHSTEAARAASAAAPVQWQQFMGHAALRDVVQLALAHNRDLRAAVLNVQAYQALYRIQRAESTPGIGVQGAATRQRTPADVANAQQAVTSGQYALGVGIASYELDLFGRVQSLNAQALQQYLAQDSTRKAAELSLVAAVASAWMGWQANQAMLDVVTRTLAANVAALDLIVAQVDNGIATDIQRFQAQTAVDSTLAQQAQLTRAVAQDLNALQALVGKQLPEAVLQTKALPGSWGLADLPVGLPAQVLTQRPDILAAEQQLQAAQANIGAARAALFPRIALTASAGSLSTELSGLLQGGSGAWSFAPQITVPLFSGGRLKANVDYATLQKDVRVAQYEKAIQTAFREVADGLVARHTYASQLAANRSLAHNSSQYLELAQLRYDHGVEGYLTVLDAQRNLLSAELQVVQTELQQALSHVQLFKALGGGMDLAH